MKPDLHAALGNAQGSGGFFNVHLFDVPEQHNVTVNLRQALDSLSKQRTEFLSFQGLRGNFAPTGENGRCEVAALVIRKRIEGILATGFSLAQATEALVAGDGEYPGAELRLAAEQVQILEDLDGRFLRSILGLCLIVQEGKQQKINRALTGTDEVVKQMLLSRSYPTDAVRIEFGVGSSHDPQRNIRRDSGLPTVENLWRELYRANSQQKRKPGNESCAASKFFN